MPAIDTNTKLALSFQSKTTGTKEIRDYGATGHIVTQVGTAQLSTAQIKINKSSLLLDGDSDYVTVPDSADWDFGADNFTIDFWAYFNSIDPQPGIFGQYADTSNHMYLFGQTSGALTFVVRSNASNIVILSASEGSIDINSWYHIALVRNGTNWQIYVNGVSRGSGTFDITYPNIAADFYFGRGTNQTPTTVYMNGYIDELRISKGIARWTSDFTPPTSPYGSDSNTKLLLHMNSYDICTTPKILTFVGTAQISTAQYKFGESSLLLDGDSDYVTVPDSADWDFGSGAFTIDFWVRYNTISTYSGYGEQYADSSHLWTLFYSAGGDKKIYLYTEGTSGQIYLYFPFDSVVNTWYHIALCRTSGANWYGFVNGVSKTVTISGGGTYDMPSIAADLRIGKDTNNTGYLNGYIDEYRVSKGIARWTSDFTPPTTPNYLQYYTRTAAALPSNDADLATVFTEEEKFDIKSADSIRVNQTATGTNKSIFQFKDVIPGNNVATLTWTGQSTVAGSDSTIYLQVYNRDTTTWVTVDSDTTTAADTNFTLTGVVTGLSDYLDSDGIISCRVYQTAV